MIKAKSKIGMIFAKTPVKEVGLDLALQLFDCYVKPIFEYCAIVWTSDFRKSYDQKINESLLLFLKKYLKISKRTNNNRLLIFLTDVKKYYFYLNSIVIKIF